MSDFVRNNDPDLVDAPTMDPVLAPGDPKSLKFAPNEAPLKKKLA